jgi:hypothetical protein
MIKINDSVYALELDILVLGRKMSIFYNYDISPENYRDLKNACKLLEAYENSRCLDQAMGEVNYFTCSLLTMVYPFMEYLKNQDHSIKVGEFCLAFGYSGKMNFVVKVGDGANEDGDWREGIYRISTLKPPEMEPGALVPGA